MFFFTNLIRQKSGQATLEAAYLIPLLLLMLLMLLQPGILLYNRIVMNAAASETCRLLATATEQGGFSEEAGKAYVVRRLGSIPPQEIFHCHKGGCSWEIELQGGESSSQVEVSISHKVKLLPLIGSASGLLGLTEEAGFFEQKVTACAPTQPQWVAASERGLDPAGWIEKWL